MDYPSWVTPPNLGVFSQNYSFNLNPIVIQFSAGQNSLILAINGSLPNGLIWMQSAQTVVITGVATATGADINSRITFRITQSNGAIADRTYFLTLSAVALPPSWVGQNTFLGFQSNTLPQSYQLTATPSISNQHVAYSIFSSAKAGNVNVNVTVGQYTGLLVCDASNVTVNSTVLVGVSATTTSSSNITLSIDVVTQDTAPNWITPAGILGTYSGEDFVEINLVAEDPEGFGVSYALVTNPDNAPLSVATDGLLYGRLPNVLSITTYTFEVSATNGTGTSYRTFSIIVNPAASSSLLTWVTPSNLGSINEGQFIRLPIVAETQRNVTIKYYVTGGIVPPHFQLGITDGILIGFCEFHAVSKTYNFDIMASDNYQSIVRQFSVTINKVYGDQFFSAYIPVTGDLKEAWIADTGNILVREPGTIKFDSIQDSIVPPILNIVNGLVVDYETADELVDQSTNWLNELSLQIGAAANSAVSSNTSVIYRNIDDTQAGANASVYSSAVYNTNVQTNGLVYPISIKNIRQILISNKSFINGGSGTGCILSPVLNWSTGALQSIQIINSGSGYVSPPVITITGSGTGATARAVLGLVGATVIDTGQGWSPGDTIQLDIGIIETAFFNITVTATGTNGSLVSFTINTPGDYIQIPNLDQLTITNGSAYATISPVWGIVSAIVLTGGQNYQNSINFSTVGTEILPSWQTTYSPIIQIGNINAATAQLASNILNAESNTLYGETWIPNIMVFQWQGLKWLGTTSFDIETTTFDGDSTRFEETQSPAQTIFDMNLTQFDYNSMLLDYSDPLEYNLFQLWGANFNTPYDLYTTIFDALPPRLTSNTLVNKWIVRNNKVYSSNNSVW